MDVPEFTSIKLALDFFGSGKHLVQVFIKGEEVNMEDQNMAQTGDKIGYAYQPIN